MIKPAYTEKMLLWLVSKTTDIADHQNLISLYEDLQKQGDIVFSEALKTEISMPSNYIRFIEKIITETELYDFYIKIIELQQKGYANITCRLDAELKVHRQVLQFRNKNN